MQCVSQTHCATLLFSSLLPKPSHTSGTGGCPLALAAVEEAEVAVPPEWTHFPPISLQTALLMKDLHMELLTHNP